MVHTHQFIRAIQFRETLKPYKNVFVFCGHRHQDFQNGTPHYVQETFHYFHNASVGRTLNRAYQQNAMNKAQGIYVQVFADKVVVRGREFSNRTFIEEANWSIPSGESACLIPEVSLYVKEEGNKRTNENATH